MNKDTFFNLQALQPLQDGKRISNQVQNVAFIQCAEVGGFQPFRNCPQFTPAYLETFNKKEYTFNTKTN